MLVPVSLLSGKAWWWRRWWCTGAKKIATKRLLMGPGEEARGTPRFANRYIYGGYLPWAFASDNLTSRQEMTCAS